MILRLNGKQQEFPPKLTIAELLDRLGLSKRPVAVEVNKLVVPSREHQSWPLQERDQVEIVSFTGGG